MTRRRKIQIISVVAAALVALAGTTTSGYLLAARYRTDLEYSYRRAFHDLTEYVSGMETALTKAAYANTPTQQNGIASLLIKDASGAKAALAVLPLNGDSMDTVQKFVAQVEDFSSSVSAKVSAGTALSQDEEAIFQNLGEYAALLKVNLNQVQTAFDQEDLHMGKTKAILTNLRIAEDLPTIGTSLETAAADFKDYPTLIYDGPFSDHIMQQKPKLLDGRTDISREQAQKAAASFFSLDSKQLSFQNDTAGNLPTYNFSGPNLRVSVTKAGGVVASLLNSRTVEKANLTFEQASEKAQEFLRKNSMDRLTESYYVMNDNICTIQYAYAEGDITFYPDLIKVAVALDNGEIMEYNGTGYIMNHHNREPQTPALTKEQAQKSVSPRLNVEKGNLAVIPTSSLGEVLCYEFVCKNEAGEEFLIYIHADTGMEEQIFLLLHSDSGILVA